MGCRLRKELIELMRQERNKDIIFYFLGGAMIASILMLLAYEMFIKGIKY